ncbi:hypothetical protein THAOC_24549, partial [Thalassiosira oceanica]
MYVVVAAAPARAPGPVIIAIWAGSGLGLSCLLYQIVAKRAFNGMKMQKESIYANVRSTPPTLSDAMEVAGMERICCKTTKKLLIRADNCAAALGDSAAEIRRSYRMGQDEALDKFVRKISSDGYRAFGVALSLSAHYLRLEQ